MAYDEKLVERIRKAFPAGSKAVEKKMFGGVAFLLDGKMTVGVLGDELIARVPPEENDALVRRPHARQFDYTGRPMKGWIYIAPAGLKTPASLKGWIETAVGFARALPAKTPKKRPPPKLPGRRARTRESVAAPSGRRVVRD